MVSKLTVVGLRGFPDVMGGIETHCQNLYPRLAAGGEGREIVVLARSPYVGRRAYAWGGVRVVPVWTARNRYLETIVHTLIAVFWARLAERSRMLHVHAIGPGLAAPLARALGMRVVATHHGEDYARAKWGRVARAALRAGETLMVSFAHQVICVNEASARSLRARFPSRAGRIHFVPNGAVMPSPAPGAERILDELGVEPSRFVLAVGRLVPEKGFHELVAAFKRARTPFKLVVVGGADHGDAFSRNLQAEASDRIVFAGVRRGDELAVLYRHAALFVLPSHHEGHPIVALEAIWSDAPVLLSDIPPNRGVGLPEDNYFPVGDVDALARRLGGEDFAALRNRDPGLKDRYDWTGIADRTGAILFEEERP
jgi:glycosyltransferase involved in cell wall biosynthesis